MSKVNYLEGPAGSVTIHNCRSLHFFQGQLVGKPSAVATQRVFGGDAMPYTHNPLQAKYMGAIARGQPARWAHHDPRFCLLPPDWSGGHTSIFALPQEESLPKHRPALVAGGIM